VPYHWCCNWYNCVTCSLFPGGGDLQGSWGRVDTALPAYSHMLQIMSQLNKMLTAQSGYGALSRAQNQVWGRMEVFCGLWILTSQNCMMDNLQETPFSTGKNHGFIWFLCVLFPINSLYYIIADSSWLKDCIIGFSGTQVEPKSCATNNWNLWIGLDMHSMAGQALAFVVRIFPWDHWIQRLKKLKCIHWFWRDCQMH